MTYNNLPTRKRNQLKGFDYSKSGHYFITICVNKNKELLWNTNNQINDAGNMINK